MLLMWANGNTQIAFISTIILLATWIPVILRFVIFPWKPVELGSGLLADASGTFRRHWLLPKEEFSHRHCFQFILLFFTRFGVIILITLGMLFQEWSTYEQEDDRAHPQHNWGYFSVVDYRGNTIVDYTTICQGMIGSDVRPCLTLRISGICTLIWCLMAILSTVVSLGGVFAAKPWMYRVVVFQFIQYTYVVLIWALGGHFNILQLRPLVELGTSWYFALTACVWSLLIVYYTRISIQFKDPDPYRNLGWRSARARAEAAAASLQLMRTSEAERAAAVAAPSYRSDAAVARHRSVVGVGGGLNLAPPSSSRAERDAQVELMLHEQEIQRRADEMTEARERERAAAAARAVESSSSCPPLPPDPHLRPFCSGCSLRLTPQARFCANCGLSVLPHNQQPASGGLAEGIPVINHHHLKDDQITGDNSTSEPLTVMPTTISAPHFPYIYSHPQLEWSKFHHLPQLSPMPDSVAPTPPGGPSHIVPVPAQVYTHSQLGYLIAPPIVFPPYIVPVPAQVYPAAPASTNGFDRQFQLTLTDQHRQRRYERVSIAELERLALSGEKSECETFCIIEADWLTQWRNYVCALGERPGVITNHRLFDGSTIRTNLVHGTDYHSLHTLVWHGLRSLYGGGPIIQRPTSDIYLLEKPTQPIALGRSTGRRRAIRLHVPQHKPA